MIELLSSLLELMTAVAGLTLSDRTWELVPAIVGGVIGALAGGIPAYALARSANAATERKDRDVRLNADIALLYSAAQRLIEITDGLFTVCVHFNEQLDTAVLSGNRDMPLHGILMPLTGIGDEEVRFTTDEIALFFRAGRNEIANDLLLLSRRHASDMRSLQAYSSRREAFAASLVPTQLEGTVGTVELTGTEAMRAKVTAQALDEMAETLLSRFNTDRRTAMRLSAEFGLVAKEMYPDSRVPSLVSEP